MDRVKIKEKAKEMIKDNKWNIIKPILFLIVIESIVFGVSSGFNFQTINTTWQATSSTIISILVIPLSIGYDKYILNFIRSKKQNTQKIIFSKYKYFVPIFLSTMIVSFLVCFFSLFFIIPGIIVALSFSMVPYLLADEVYDNKDPFEVVSKSKDMMKGYKMNYFIFIISFIGWNILSLLTLGILYIYVGPYMVVSNGLYYEELKKIYKK